MHEFIINISKDHAMNAMVLSIWLPRLGRDILVVEMTKCAFFSRFRILAAYFCCIRKM